MFKVGDYVKSAFAEGVIQDIHPCEATKCSRFELTLAEKGKGVRFYHHADSFEQVQRVWRHLYEIPFYGYVVWEIYEVTGESKKQTCFEDSADGGFIMVTCSHFFDKEKAITFLNEPGWGDYQKIIVV